MTTSCSKGDILTRRFHNQGRKSLARKFLKTHPQGVGLFNEPNNLEKHVYRCNDER